MNRGRALLLALIFAAGILVVGPAAPAHACSCSAGPKNDYVGHADLAFVGRVIDTQKTDESSYVRRQTIAVDKVYKGPVLQKVAWFGLTEGCQAPLPSGRRLVLLAIRDGAGRWTEACGGRDLVTEADLVAMEPQLGPPTTIVRDMSDDVRPRDDSPLLFVAVGAGAALLLGGASWVWRRRRPGRVDACSRS